MKIDNIKEKMEVLQLSIFINIICELLKKHKQFSICKLVTLVYIIKQYRFLGNNIYTGKDSKNLIYKGLSLLLGQLNRYCDSLEYIFKAIHILLINDIVILENNSILILKKDIQTEITFLENKFLNKVIEESKFITDRQFIKEVIYNV